MMGLGAVLDGGPRFELACLEAFTFGLRRVDSYL
jgi:hypothetical protein